MCYYPFFRKILRVPRLSLSFVSALHRCHHTVLNPTGKLVVRRPFASSHPTCHFHTRTLAPTSEFVSAISFTLAGTDLPDDDYTTLVPPVKQTNGPNRKLPQVPIIVEDQENALPSTKGTCVCVRDFRAPGHSAWSWQLRGSLRTIGAKRRSPKSRDANRTSTKRRTIAPNQRQHRQN